MKAKKVKKSIIDPEKDHSLSRKDALRRLGLTAFSASTMMMLLNPAKGEEGDSPTLPPDW